MRMQNEDSRSFCVFNHFKNTLISQLTQLHPGDEFLIQHHLRKLFPALHTPTHPPYALMIHNAIKGLEEAATEEAILEFITREYHDLPWAHAKILSVQLENLCEIGELARADGGRFVLRVNHDDEEEEQCDCVSEKRKRSDLVEEDIQEGQLEVFGKQSQDPRLHLETTYSSQPCDGPSESGLYAHCINKNINPQDQAEDLGFSSFSNQKETSSSSQPAASISQVNPIHNSEQQLVVLTSEGSLESIVSTGIKLPPAQLQQQPSSDVDLGTASKREASLTCEDDQSQHCNQGLPKVNIDEDSVEQKAPKCARGRPSDDDIHNKQRPNINKIEKQHHYGRGRGRGRPCRVRGVRLSQGSGQASPPKLNQNTKQCKEQLQQKHQDKQYGRGRRCDQGRVLGRGHGRPPKPIQNTNKHEVQLPQEVQAKLQHVQKTNHCEGQLLPQDQGQGLLNSPSSGRSDNQSLKRKQMRLQNQVTCHKSESGEAEPPAGLRLGWESRFGSGDVFQANYEAYKSQWQLIPVTRR